MHLNSNVYLWGVETWNLTPRPFKFKFLFTQGHQFLRIFFDSSFAYFFSLDDCVGVFLTVLIDAGNIFHGFTILRIIWDFFNELVVFWNCLVKDGVCCPPMILLIKKNRRFPPFGKFKIWRFLPFDSELESSLILGRFETLLR